MELLLNSYGPYPDIHIYNPIYVDFSIFYNFNKNLNLYDIILITKVICFVRFLAYSLKYNITTGFCITAISYLASKVWYFETIKFVISASKYCVSISPPLLSILDSYWTHMENRQKIVSIPSTLNYICLLYTSPSPRDS